MSDDAQRKKAVAFLVSWVSGTSSVSVGISEDMAPFAGDPDLLCAFIAGWTLFSIEHPEQKKDMVACNLAALQCAIKWYHQNPKIPRDKFLDQRMQDEQEGKLKHWIETNLKK